MRHDINRVLESIKEELAESLEESSDSLDDFMVESAERVMLETGWDEDAALDLVFEVAESGLEEGVLPEIPTEDAPPEEVAEWLEAANNSGFLLQVIVAAKSAQGS